MKTLAKLTINIFWNIMVKFPINLQMTIKTQKVPLKRGAFLIIYKKITNLIFLGYFVQKESKM